VPDTPQSAPEPRELVLVTDRNGTEQPFSKGLLATSIMATGLTPAAAFALAADVDAELRTADSRRITADHLAALTSEVLTRKAGGAVAVRYDAWRKAKRSPKPIIVLLGGASGTGKSTIATRLAWRLGITRVIPTDTVREIMRTFVPASLVPELHRSSFEPPPDEPDAPFESIYRGFRRQTAAVATGIAGVVSRMIAEREDAIIEGVHVIPGLDLGVLATTEDATVVTMLVTVDDPAIHRAHFLSRIETHHGRAPERYLQRIETIRRIHDRLREEAKRHGVPEVDATFLDQAIQAVVEHVVARATEPRGARA